MHTSPRARNPWTVEFRRDFPCVLFDHFREAVKKSATSCGIVVEEATVRFTNIHRLVRDLSKFSHLTKSEVNKMLNKSFGPRQKNFRTSLLVTDEKPFVVTFLSKKNAN